VWSLLTTIISPGIYNLLEADLVNLLYLLGIQHRWLDSQFEAFLSDICPI